MAQKETVIIELDLDASDFTKEAANITGEISKLKKEQKEMKKAGEEGSVAYQKNSEALRENKKALNDTNKAITNLKTANTASAGSNDQLRAQLSLLTKEYNGLSKEQRENGERGKSLDAQINQTTAALKNNEEGVGDNRRSVGDYGKALEGTKFGVFIDGLKSMGAAFLANPGLLVITAIVGALALLKKAFTRSEEGSNKFAKAQAVLSGIFTSFLDIVEVVAKGLVSMFENPKKAISDFADFVKQNIINRFTGLLQLLPALGKAIGQVFSGDFAEAGKTATNAVAKATLGVEDITGKIGEAGDAFKKFGNDAVIAANKAAKLADSEAALVKSQRNLRVIQLEFLKDAEKQRQIRDDESLSIAERTAANEKLGAILQEQSKQELAIANQALSVARQKIALDGESTENLDQQAEALIEIADINERITGQQSEQLVNINSLLRDEKTLRTEAANFIIKQTQEQLNLFIASQGIRAKSLEEEVLLAEQISIKKTEILKKQLAQNLISNEVYETELLNIQNEFLLKQTEATIANAQTELDLIVSQNESKLDANQFLNDELFTQEQERQAQTLEAQLAFEALRLEQGVISQQEYNSAVNQINAENEALNEALKTEKAEADNEQKIVDLENQREIDLLNREDEFALRQEDLNRQRAQELLNAESTGASEKLINEKYAKFEEELDSDKRSAQIGEAQQAFGAISELVSGNAEASKAAAIAQATINGFQAVTSVLAAPSTIPEPLGSIVKGVSATAIGASSLLNVRKIANTPVPSKKAAKGGIFGGNLHSGGGTKGYFDDGTQIEVEKDELFMVVNRNSTGMINGLSDLNEAGGGVSFGKGGSQTFLEDGGIGIGNIARSVETENGSTSTLLTAIQALPAPVVIIQDINESQGETIEVAQRAII